MYWIKYVKPISIGVASLALFLAGWYVNNLRFQQYKTEVQAVIKEQEAKNKGIIKQQEIINRSTKETYEAKLNSIKSYYDRVRYESSGSVSSIPNASRGANEGSQDLVLDCAFTTQQVISLQDWITKQSKTSE